MTECEIIQLTIAVCKEEVEAVIGSTTLDVMDDGSPWGRAFMMASGMVKDIEAEAANEGRGM